jgi:broad specificity phosphatase PhoE
VETSVVILQHGEKQPLPGDPGLTDLGRRQAERAATTLAVLSPAAIISSPSLRARQTADPLAERTGLVLAIDPRLRERLNLETDDDREAFLKAWRTSTSDRGWSPPRGRSSRATAADMKRAIDAHAIAGRLVVLAGHGGATIDLLRDLLGDAELETRAPGTISSGVPGGAITALIRRDSAWTVTGIRSTDHLPRSDRM